MVRTLANAIAEGEEDFGCVHDVVWDLIRRNLAGHMHDQRRVIALSSEILGQRADPNEGQELFSF